jgi:hypothetical protein
MYSGIVALTIASFAAVAYVTVSNQLKRSLDTSLARVATSLHAVIRREQRAMQRPLLPSRKERRRDADVRGDALEFFVKRSLQELVGPILPSDTVADADPVWAAVYEHMLINSSAYLIQVTDRSGRVVWKSDNLRRDSLPVVKTFERHGASFEDGRLFTNYTLDGVRYRMILSQGDVAEITAAYPAYGLYPYRWQYHSSPAGISLGVRSNLSMTLPRRLDVSLRRTSHSDCLLPRRTMRSRG